MTEAHETAIIAAIAPTIAATAALIVGLVNAKKSNVIHALVNSNLDRVKTELAYANERIGELLKRLDEEE